jgi:hypothetical protein
MRHHLAVVACLALTTSIAHARPAHHKHHHKKHRAKAAPVDAPVDAAVIVEDRDPSEVDVVVREHAARRARDWQVAIGPYLWASSVDANVSLGSASVASSVDFLQTTQHAKYGAEVLADVRYRRFSLSGDLMYGVVGLEGGNAVGPLMVTVNGTASSLLVDGYAGYQVAGNSLLSLEARGGVRYQRTEVTAAVGVGGSPVASPEIVDAARDVLAGARLVMRPSSRFSIAGAADVGVFGTSSTTWSASADASLQVTSHVLLSVGYRTLTIEGASVSMVMHGPRTALQLVF